MYLIFFYRIYCGGLEKHLIHRGVHRFWYNYIDTLRFVIKVKLNNHIYEGMEKTDYLPIIGLQSVFLFYRY